MIDCKALVAEAVHRWSQFDTDEPVSGADLVEWFADWRARAKAAGAVENPTDQSPFEKAARAAGWELGGDSIIFDSKVWDTWKEAASWSGEDGWPDSPVYSTWEECCNGENLSP